MRFLKLTVAYDGTHFSGWQWQPTQRTPQGALEAAVLAITGETTRLRASGRTDAGVHALGQVVSWETETQLPTDVLVRALNARLPHDVVVLEVSEAPTGFHAVINTISKRYRYMLYDHPVRDIFARHYVWQVWQRLDATAMHQAAQRLRGEHDFKSFESSGSPRRSTVRTVYDITVERRTMDYGERIVVEVEANGFLYTMVRNIVGSLVEVGRGNRDANWLSEVLERRDRRAAGATAPPQGLYLLQVHLDW